MNTYTVFFKAEASGIKFRSSTVVRAADKPAAAALVLRDYAIAKEVTGVMVGR